MGECCWVIVNGELAAFVMGDVVGFGGKSEGMYALAAHLTGVMLLLLLAMVLFDGDEILADV